jgi:hypothetical protein
MALEIEAGEHWVRAINKDTSPERGFVRRGNVEKRSDQTEECVRFLDPYVRIYPTPIQAVNKFFGKNQDMYLCLEKTSVVA